MSEKSFQTAIDFEMCITYKDNDNMIIVQTVQLSALNSYTLNVMELKEKSQLRKKPHPDLERKMTLAPPCSGNQEKTKEKIVYF